MQCGCANYSQKGFVAHPKSRAYGDQRARVLVIGRTRLVVVEANRGDKVLPLDLPPSPEPDGYTLCLYNTVLFPGDHRTPGPGDIPAYVPALSARARVAHQGTYAAVFLRARSSGWTLARTSITFRLMSECGGPHGYITRIVQIYGYSLTWRLPS